MGCVMWAVESLLLISQQDTCANIDTFKEVPESKQISDHRMFDLIWSVFDRQDLVQSPMQFMDNYTDELMGNHNDPKMYDLRHNSSSFLVNPAVSAVNDSVIAQNDTDGWLLARSAADLRIPKGIIIYVFPVILLFGMVGNILSILVLVRKAMQRNNSSTYLIMLAITNMSVLTFSCFKTWLRLVSDFELLHYSDAMCKILKYVFFTSTHFSAWLVVLLTCERFLVVCFPFRASHFWFVHRPWIVTLITISIIMLTNINQFWTSQLRVTEQGRECAVYDQHNTLCTVFSNLNMLIYSLVPAIIVFSLNTAIIVTIARHRYSGETITSPRTPLPLIRRQNQQRLTIMLLCICVLWLLLTGPYAIIDSGIPLNNMERGTEYLVRTLAYTFMYINHAINFYIYCLTGKKFRFELKRMCVYKVFSTSKHMELPVTVSPPRKDATLKLSRRSYPMEQLYK